MEGAIRIVLHRPTEPSSTLKILPKNTRDVYPLNSTIPDWKKDLWKEMKGCHSVLGPPTGFRIFRVDNRITKPNAFWECTISEIQAEYSRCHFPCEAIPRPKMMQSDWRRKEGTLSPTPYFSTWR